MDEQTIIALCTPQGSGAIALLRISGEKAVEVVDRIARLSSGLTLAQGKSHTIHHGHIYSGKVIVDEVLFFLMRGPQTFTGEDTVEISCHNNRFIIERIIQLAIKAGAHHAERGEFSKRAFLNKKIDLLQAEAIHELISAQTELALKKSMSQLKGTLSFYATQVENDLISLLSLVEASFEFLDEEQKDIDLDKIISENLNKLLQKTEDILANFSQQQHIRQGIRIALLGNVNVGKSTLFNALVNKERAIVTSTPGTTRDAIETTIHANGTFWLLIDTAGLRQTKNDIEQLGINRSWQEAKLSDIILLVFDGTKKLTNDEEALYKKIHTTYKEKVIMVANHIDKLKTDKNIVSPVDAKISIKVSAKHKIGIDTLKEKIEEKIEKLLSKAQSPFLLNQRQHSLILELNIKLKQLAKENANRIQYEIAAYEIKHALALVAQLTGKTINERMMDAVFSSFCLGK